jgi:hypothetical protein
MCFCPHLGEGEALKIISLDPVKLSEPIFSEEDYSFKLELQKKWVGTYVNSQGSILTITKTEQDLSGKKGLEIDYKLVIKGDIPCVDLNGTLVVDENTDVTYEESNPVSLELNGKELKLEMAPWTQEHPMCIGNFDTKFTKK